MAAKKWLPIVVGIIIFVVIVGVGLIGGLAYMVTRQVHVQTMSNSGGQVEFERMLAAFAGQKAFIELPADRDGDAVVHRELETKQPGSLSTLHVRVWVPDDKKLVRVDLPFWLMRLTGNKPIRLETGQSTFREVTLSVTPEEIERRGPGLILDHTARHGERLLVWTD
jgi:uncharacterized protein YneF (UPF0154 family)